MTNWEKYFGTPDRAASTTVEPYEDADCSKWVCVYNRGEYVGRVRWSDYDVWLESEADHGN